MGLNPLLGEIQLVSFNFAPKGWAFCNGQILPINQNQALFALLGTSYGGNGQTTFALPDLRNRTIVGAGSGAGLTSYTNGQTVGAASITLAPGEMPAHTHPFNVSSATATLASPVGAHLAVAAAAAGTPYDAGGGGTMPGAVSATGGGGAHENRQPFLVMNYIIALQGIFPSHS